MTVFVERIPPDPAIAAYPGFYMVRSGMRFEIGDQIVDPSGDAVLCSLSHVGQPVPDGLMVLRIDRRKESP